MLGFFVASRRSRGKREKNLSTSKKKSREFRLAFTFKTLPGGSLLPMVFLCFFSFSLTSSLVRSLLCYGSTSANWKTAQLEFGDPAMQLWASCLLLFLGALVHICCHQVGCTSLTRWLGAWVVTPQTPMADGLMGTTEVALSSSDTFALRP